MKNLHLRPEACGPITDQQRRRHYSYTLTPRHDAPGRTGTSICGKPVGDQTAINTHYPRPPQLPNLPVCKVCYGYLANILRKETP
jgi:hypothetical protein